MFTGLVEAQATVSSVERDAGGARIQVSTPLAGELRAGDSVAVNGCCLTVVDLRPGELAFDVVDETFARTTLGGLQAGDPVNLEVDVLAKYVEKLVARA